MAGHACTIGVVTQCCVDDDVDDDDNGRPGMHIEGLI